MESASIGVIAVASGAVVQHDEAGVYDRAEPEIIARWAGKSLLTALKTRCEQPPWAKCGAGSLATRQLRANLSGIVHAPAFQVDANVGSPPSIPNQYAGLEG